MSIGNTQEVMGPPTEDIDLINEEAPIPLMEMPTPTRTSKEIKDNYQSLQSLADESEIIKPEIPSHVNSL